MKEKVFSGLLFTLLVIGLLTSASEIKQVTAGGTIYIMADGSINPSTAPIQRDGDIYTITAELYDTIVVERNNIVVDGAGHTLQGAGSTGIETGIKLFGRSNVTIVNMKIQGFRYGIRLYAASNNSISRNRIADSLIGILLGHSANHNNISRNSITANDEGVLLEESSNNNAIYGNNIGSNKCVGVVFTSGSYNAVSENHIANNLLAMYLAADNCILRNNIITDNWIGIAIYESSNCSLYGNLFSSNTYGLQIIGSELSRLTHSIDTSNLVNGKPTYYYINQTDLTIDNATHPQVGYLALINSANVTLDGLTLADNGQGMLLAYTKDSTIRHSNITQNYSGIELYKCSNINISRNTVTASYDYGIHLGYSSTTSISENYVASNGHGIYLCRSLNNTISGNSVAANHGGIRLDYSSNFNNISRNNLTNNVCGISLRDSSSNTIYHNNFIDNKVQADASTLCVNTWEDGYPSGGNYWSDYSDADVYSGPNQNQTGGDGIGDTPFVINDSNRDMYPLVRYERELAVSLESPSRLSPNESTLFNVTVSNSGLYSETNLELVLFINGIIINRTQIPRLNAKSLKQISYSWSPTTTGFYNVTAYMPPLANEAFTSNNVVAQIVKVRSTSTLYMDPSANNVLVNGSFTVNIAVANVTELYAWQIQLYYNPEIVNWASVSFPENHVFATKEFDMLGPVREFLQIVLRNATAVNMAEPLATTWRGTEFPWATRELTLNKWLDLDNSNTLTRLDIVWLEIPPLNLFFYLKDIRNFEGMIEITVEIARVTLGAALRGPQSGFTGSGTLSQLTFAGVAAGSSILNFSRPIGEDTVLLDSRLDEIPLEISDGHIEVWKLFGDLNGDLKVDIRDIAQAALAFGSYPSHPRWNPAADLNSDLRVDIKDIALAAKNFGKPHF